MIRLVVFLFPLLFSLDQSKAPYAELYNNKGKVDPDQASSCTGLSIKIFGSDDTEIKCKVKVNVMLARGSKIVATFVAESTDIGCGTFMTIARPGDRVIVDIKEISKTDGGRSVSVKNPVLNLTL